MHLHERETVLVDVTDQILWVSDLYGLLKITAPLFIISLPLSVSLCLSPTNPLTPNTSAATQNVTTHAHADSSGFMHYYMIFLSRLT